MPGSKMHVSGSPWFSKGLQTLFKTSKNRKTVYFNGCYFLCTSFILFFTRFSATKYISISGGGFPILYCQSMYLNLHHMCLILFKSSHNQPFQVISCTTRRKFQLKLGTQMSPTCSYHTHCCPFKVGLK